MLNNIDQEKQQLRKELKLALKHLNANWKMQSDADDEKSRFIYTTKTVNAVLEQAKLNDIDPSYALHRWYHYHTSKECENIFIENGAIKEPNYHHKTIDIYIQGISFDVKLTVYPQKLADHPYDLTTRQGKNKMIEWLYKNQSQEQRKHLKNRLFIVCDGDTPYESLCLKSNFEQIEEKIKIYLQITTEKGFNELEIFDNGIRYSIKSDIIYIK